MNRREFTKASVGALFLPSVSLQDVEPIDDDSRPTRVYAICDRRWPLNGVDTWCIAVRSRSEQQALEYAKSRYYAQYKGDYGKDVRFYVVGILLEDREQGLQPDLLVPHEAHCGIRIVPLQR